MKIDHRNPEPGFSLVTPAVVAPVTHGVSGKTAPQSRALAILPGYNTSNLPVPVFNTEEQRRERAMDMTNLDVDIRSVSPREMSALGLELYVAGHMSWEDYAELAFQPQLHPDYDATIGALEGKQAEPDSPQDFVRVWEERMAFELRYNRDDKQRIRQTERIVGVMRQLAGSTFFEV